MAEDKKSFILYADSYGLVKQLPDEIAGKLFKHILSYVNDENPETDNLLVNIAFEPIKNQLKRDLQKWENQLIDKSNSGKLGNLKRWHNDLYLQVIKNETDINDALIIANSRKASHSDNVQSQTVANIAVNDNVTVNVNVNDNDNDNVNVIKEKKITNKLDYSFLQNEPKELIDAFRKWFEYKKEIKNNYKTQVSIETAYRHLKDLSCSNFGNAIKIVNNSIANQYKGLFALKENEKLPSNVSPPSPYKKHENQKVDNFVKNFETMKNLDLTDIVIRR